MKKLFSIIICLCIAMSLMACGKKETGSTSNDTENQNSSETNESADSVTRVVLIGNQKFGDNGPMDDMANGGERAAADFGIEFKKMESEAATFEEDIRTMAQEGYDLIITTFPYMTEATKLVSKEFPDTKFAAIYQNVNTDDDVYPNVMDMVYKGQETLYIDGYMAGLATKTNVVGIIIGGEEPGTNAEGNGFMQGVYAANPNAKVEFSYASYEDTAKVKEVALAMIEKGCDFIQGDCGSADSGIVEAINEHEDVMALSVICDFTEASSNFCGTIRMGYGDAVYDAISKVADGSFQGGITNIRDITNNGYYLDWSIYEAFCDRNANYGADYASAIEKGKEIEQQILDSKFTVDYITDVPNWNNYSK